MKTILLLLLLLSPSTSYAQAVWAGQSYNHPVCSNPNCAMCRSIRAQLTSQTYTPAAYTPMRVQSPVITQIPVYTATPAIITSHIEYEMVQVPVITREKRCNGITCWYENVTTYRTERRPIQRAVQAIRNAVDVLTPRRDLLRVTELAPTPIDAVVEMLALVAPQEHEILYDLGCGDGRILVTATAVYNCRSVGIELDPNSFILAEQQVKLAGLRNRVRIYQGDVLTYTYPQADVVTMYLYPELMAKVFPLLRPGTRVVSYLHEIPGGQKVVIRDHTFYLWTKP